MINRFIHPRMKRVTIEDLSFYLDPQQATPELQKTLIFIDELLTNGPILKDSRTTTAGVVEMESGRRIFVKRENNKGWYFSAKYFFRHSRVFRAAEAAEMLRRLEVPTPRVLGVGSRRRMGILKSGYLITETLDNVLTTENFCRRFLSDSQFKAIFINTVCRYIANMHDHGIRHGDLKISNIYCMDTVEGWKFGLWDLDGTIKYPAALPQFLRTLELARVVSSLSKAMSDHARKNLLLDQLSADFQQAYNSYAAQPTTVTAICKAANRYLSRYGITPNRSDSMEN